MAKARANQDGYDDPNLDENGNPIDMTGGATTPDAPLPPVDLSHDVVTAQQQDDYAKQQTATKPEGPTTGNTGINPDAPYNGGKVTSEGGGATGWGQQSKSGPMPGWDNGKWTDPNQQGIKYRFGREIANSGLSATPENAQKLIREAIANGVQIEIDPADPSAFIWTNPNGRKESIRLVSGNNTWMFGGYGYASAGNPQQQFMDELGNVDPLAEALAQGGPISREPMPTPQAVPDYVPQVTMPDVYTPQSVLPVDNVRIPGDDRDYGTPAAPTPASPAPTPSAPAPTALPTPSAVEATAAPKTALDYASEQALLRALQGPSASDIAANIENDPAVSANRRMTDRLYAGKRATAAEQAAQNGTSASGGFNGLTRALDESRIEGEAAYAGDRVAQAVAARQQELVAALQLAQSLGQADKANLLQRQLAELNAKLTTRGQDLSEAQSLRALGLSYSQLNAQQKQFAAQLTQNDRQFGAQLTQNQKQFVASLGLDWARLNSQERIAVAQLAESARQANNNLGYNYDALEQRANESALNDALA